MTAVTLIWHVSGFVFNSVSARLLGPLRFGDLSALVGIVYVASPFYVALQTVSSRIATALSASNGIGHVRRLLSHYYRRLGLVGVTLYGFWILSSRIIADVLGIRSAIPVAIFGAVLLLSIFSHVQKGVLQGLRRYERFGVGAAVESATKLGAVTVLLLWGWRDEVGAVLALVLSTGMAIVVNQRLLSFLPPKPAQPLRHAHPLRYSLLTLATLLTLALPFAADVLAANRYLAHRAAGIYAAASLVGKVAFFVSSAITWYAFPVMGDWIDRGIDARAIFFKTVGAVVSIALLPAIIHVLWPELVVSVLFGAGYVEASNLVLWLSLAFACYSLLHSSAMYLLAQGRAAAPLVLLVTLLMQLGGFFVWHQRPEDLVGVQMTAFAAGSVVLLGVAAAPKTVPLRTVVS